MYLSPIDCTSIPRAVPTRSKIVQPTVMQNVRVVVRPKHCSPPPAIRIHKRFWVQSPRQNGWRPVRSMATVNCTGLPSHLCGDEVTVQTSREMIDWWRTDLAATLDIDNEKIHLMSPFIGGRVGGKLFLRGNCDFLNIRKGSAAGCAPDRTSTHPECGATC